VRKMTDKNEEKIAELENKVSELEHALEKVNDDLDEKVSELENALNKVNDDLDHALNMANKVEDLIAAWNSRFPDEQIPVPRPQRPDSDYVITAEEFKKRTRIPHPRDWVKKSFDPTTGEFYNEQQGDN